ncbi:MAG TPA: NADH-quinone oxidoreductase subunit A, partial [Gemmataceae bacterium]|nr:NADH-quinone oxidoreductase subunit A [Gemmataceae bacterium]
MTELVTLILIFVAVGIGFLLTNLLLGKLLRPSQPDAEKGTVYECGEPAVGSSWIQFDLRFYVVALLFVVFDVEMAFFFPWAVVFGGANRLADEKISVEEKVAIQTSLTGREVPANKVPDAESAKSLAEVAFLDILIFFGVLLVGFAYLWKRGDLEWVRSMAGQHESGPMTQEKASVE